MADEIVSALDGATNQGHASGYPANAGEFASRWNAMDDDEREAFTRRLVDTAQMATACAIEHAPLMHPEGWDQRFAEDVQQLARFMQARDAQQYGVQIDGVLTPSWDDSGEAGQQEYLKDAAAAASALSTLGWVPTERKH
jgi:hypothetical protein